MASFPKTERGLRSRIKSYRAAMQRERRMYGAISDGHGLRYVIYWLLLLLDDHREFAAYHRWYEKTFEGDFGEPIHKLCAAVLLHRSGKENRARLMLAELMLANTYLVPALLGQEQTRHQMWHGSNFAELEYAQDIPEEIVRALRDEDLQWLSETHGSMEFRRCEEQFIELMQQLEKETVPARRSTIMRKEEKLLDQFRAAAS